MPGVESIPPPDDSGSDAFTRFRYQAHVAFQFSLACWTEHGVTAIYCEHFEDLLVESEEELRFIAIKTRDLAYGPWRLVDLCGSSGGFRSLLRTYRALHGLDDTRTVILEARLEGVLKKGDLAEELRAPRDGDVSPELVAKCSELLACDGSEAEDFLRHVRVCDGEPAREVIQDRNLRFLRTVAGGMSANALKEIYDSAIKLLETAMTAQLLTDRWPLAIVVASTREDALAGAAQAKRLDRSALDQAFGPLKGSDTPLLIGEIDASLLRATGLERKLVAAGASDNVLRRTKDLRAHAGRRLEEVRAARRRGVDDQLEDLNNRLLTVAEAVTAGINTDRAANAIWLALLAQLMATPAACDPLHLLAQDSMLLAGQVCQLSDECRFEWGVSADDG